MALATETGLQFSAVQDGDLLGKMKTFSLFNRGSARKMRNVMTTETDVARLSIFDYQYTTGGGESSHTYRQTVVALESEALVLPVFSLRPEGFFHKLGAAIGMQDIDFENHPEFSDSFVLTGGDEQAVRTFLTTTFLITLCIKKEVVLRVQAACLFIFAPGSVSLRKFANS